MNIMFMTRFPDGTPTRFVDKILKGLVGSDYEMAPVKLHTIRESFRIKEGMKLSLRVWSGKPYRSSQVEFAEAVCVRTQEVEIRWSTVGFKMALIFVDGRLLNPKEMHVISVNDGFTDINHFFRHFNKSATYNLIHWTNLKY